MTFSQVSSASCPQYSFGYRVKTVSHRVANIGLASVQYALGLPRVWSQLIPVWRDTFLNLRVILKFKGALDGSGTWTSADREEALLAIRDARKLLILRGFNWTVPGSSMLLPLIINSKFGQAWLVPRTMRSAELRNAVTMFIDNLDAKIEDYKFPIDEQNLDQNVYVNTSNEELLRTIDIVMEQDLALLKKEGAIQNVILIPPMMP